MTIRRTAETEAVRDSLTEEVPPEIQAIHLRAIFEAAVGEQLDDIRADYHVMADRIRELQTQVFEARTQIEILTGQVRSLEHDQKADESAAIAHLRRTLKAVILAEIIIGFGWDADLHEGNWEDLCIELYRRCGKLTDHTGRRYWTKPPGVSDETKTLVAGLLNYRQEA